jgi:alpha-mannosidase
MLFPTGRAIARFTAATTFDVTTRATSPPDDTTWVHPAPATFPQQGWVAANGLMVVAPGLYEAEVTPEGTIALTIVRAVGWLARMDLTTRPIPAGPGMPTPGAQCLGPVHATIALLPAGDPPLARAVELGLRAVPAGPDGPGGHEQGLSPLLDAGRSLLALSPGAIVLSALKPAERGDGVVLRVLNPTDEVVEAVVDLGFPVETVRPVRLDEGPSDDGEVALEGDRIRLTVEPHRLRSVLMD